MYPSHLNPAVAGGVSPEDASPDQKGAFSPTRGVVPGSMGNMGRSGLSVMMDREKAHRAAGPATSPSDESDPEATPRMPVQQLRSVSDASMETGSKHRGEDDTPKARKASLVEEDQGGSESDDPNSGSALRRFLASEVVREDVERADENTPLLGGESTSKAPSIRQAAGEWGRRAKKITPRDVVRACVEDPVKALPAVVLGLLLNVLDGVSYGMIL